MILTVNNTSKAGRPCVIYDADGYQIHNLVYADTRTGQIRRHKTKNGELVFNDRRDEIVFVSEVRKTPFKIVWLEQTEGWTDEVNMKIKIEVTDFRCCLARKMGVDYSQTYRQEMEEKIKRIILDECNCLTSGDKDIEANINSSVQRMEVTYKDLM